MLLTEEENAFLLKTYFSTKSYKMCMKKFTEKFGDHRANKMSIRRLVHRFTEHGTVKPRSHSQMKSCECALIANVNGYSSIRGVIRHLRTTENKS